eukprot:3126729-Pleurochrysis_carterae.AAC.2
MTALSPGLSVAASVDSTDDLEQMMQMPNPLFNEPVTAEENSILDSLMSGRSSECEECAPPAATSMPSSSQQAAESSITSEYKSMKGKYKRVNGKGIRSPWDVHAAKHMTLVRSGQLLSQERCCTKCVFGHCCMQNAFTLTTLRKCAVRVFGESVMDGQPPTIPNHTAVRNWFGLVFACRIVVANEVTSIDFNVDGRRVCRGAFAAAYAIPPASMDDIVRRVMGGAHAWVTYASTATARPRSDKPSLVRIATTWWLNLIRCYDIMPHLRGVIIHPVSIVHIHLGASSFESDHLRSLVVFEMRMRIQLVMHAALACPGVRVERDILK